MARGKEGKGGSIGGAWRAMSPQTCGRDAQEGADEVMQT